MPRCAFPALFRILFLTLLGVISTSLSTSLLAHDLWIERDTRTYTLAYGHERSGHEGAKHLEYKPETVKRAGCLSVDGQTRDAEIGKTYPLTLKGDCAVSWFLISSGYWSKTPYGTRNLPKGEAGMVMDSWLSMESVKRVDRWGDGLARPLTHELELVPTENPIALKTGDKLHLRAYYQGKPAAQVTVAYFGKPRGVTGTDGAMNIRLNNPGPQLIQGSLELPLNDAKADRAIHATTLQFDLP